MRRLILTPILVVVVFVAVACLTGCAPGSGLGSTPGTPPVRADVAEQLRLVFGERLGEHRVQPRLVIAAVDGGVNDSELFSILLAAAATHSAEPSIQLIFMPKGDGSAYQVVEWTRSSGRLVRMRGDGSARGMLATPPSGAAVAEGYTAVPEGGIANGVDEAAMQSYAAGEPVPWDESVK